MLQAELHLPMSPTKTLTTKILRGIVAAASTFLCRTVTAAGIILAAVPFVTPAVAQTPSVYQNIVFSRTGQPLAGANVAICLSNPGVSTPPCHDLATTYTDITVGTQCVGSNALTYGTGCSNPGLTDGFGNYIIYASAGQTLWAQISGPRITTYVVPFEHPVTAVAA